MTPDQLIKTELARAKAKWPGWPTDTIHCVAIMIEEAGESMQAALNYVYENGSLDDLKKEVAQTGAMCYRILENLPDDNC
jgi:hypothetical protein